MKNHLKNECPNMSVTCANCDCEVAMGLKNDHNCVKALRAIITQYSKIITQQSDIIARLQGVAGPNTMAQSQTSMMTLDGDNLTSASTHQQQNPFRIPGSLLNQGSLMSDNSPTQSMSISDSVSNIPNF